MYVHPNSVFTRLGKCECLQLCQRAIGNQQTIHSHTLQMVIVPTNHLSSLLGRLGGALSTLS